MKKKAIAILLTMAVAFCFAGCATESASSQEGQAQPEQKSQDEIIEDAGKDYFSTPCPVKGSVSGVFYYNSGTKWQALDGSVHRSDALDLPILFSASKESGIDSSNPRNVIGEIDCCIFFLDKQGDYIGFVQDAAYSVPAYGELRETVTENLSSHTNNMVPSTYEVYVYRVVLQDGSKWGADDGYLAGLEADTRYQVIFQKSCKIGEGKVAVL